MFKYFISENLSFFSYMRDKDQDALGELYCIFIYINNELKIKYNYQRNSFFKFDLSKYLQNNKINITIKFYKKNKKTREITRFKINASMQNLPQYHNERNTNETTFHEDELAILLPYFLTKKSQLNKDFFTKNKNTILKIATNDKHFLNSIELGYTLYKLINSLNYAQIIEKNEEILKLITKTNPEDQDFLFGIFYYKINSPDLAKKYFKKTKLVENNITNISKSLFTYDNNIKFLPNTQKNKPTTNKRKNNTTILISCDVGYLFSYKENLIESLNHHDLDIHINVLYTNENSIDIITSEFKKYLNRIYFTFEKTQIDVKATHSSISRYLVAKDIMVNTKSNILIVDIDIDFSTKSIDNLLSLKTNKISCYINENELPWKKILAGFFYLPFNKISLDFLNTLSYYLNKCLEDKNLYWTLDQIALTSVYDSNIFSKNSFQNLRDLNTIRLKQIDPQKRIEARKNTIKYENY